MSSRKKDLDIQIKLYTKRRDNLNMEYKAYKMHTLMTIMSKYLCKNIANLIVKHIDLMDNINNIPMLKLKKLT